MAITALSLSVLIAAAFLPPLLWMALLRNTERYGREPVARVVQAFLWGAVVGVLVAVVLSLLVILFLLPQIGPAYEFLAQRGFSDPVALVTVCVVAPFVEEFAKALGVLRVRRFINEPEDGLVYGGSAGLGFAATENVLYGLVLLAESLEASLVLVAIRSVSSALLHATATGSTGYGIGRAKVWGGSVVPWFLLAVLLHGAFNFLASIGEQLSATYGEATAVIGLVAAVAFGVLGFALIRRKIREKDAGWEPS
jgi:RsiW-degrading membrane proteinase PrsW (M82 family)